MRCDRNDDDFVWSIDVVHVERKRAQYPLPTFGETGAPLAGCRRTTSMAASRSWMNLSPRPTACSSKYRTCSSNSFCATARKLYAFTTSSTEREQKPHRHRSQKFYPREGRHILLRPPRPKGDRDLPAAIPPDFRGETSLALPAPEGRVPGARAEYLRSIVPWPDDSPPAQEETVPPSNGSELTCADPHASEDSTGDEASCGSRQVQRGELGVWLRLVASGW
jgi:hypothetical protein